MIELLSVLLIVGCLVAAPIIILVCWLAVIFLALRALPYAGWILMALIGVTVLSGCAKAPVVSVNGPSVPDQLLACKPEPVPPAKGTQRTVALYVIDLADAGDDCRTKLGAVRTIVRPQE